MTAALVAYAGLAEYCTFSSWPVRVHLDSLTYTSTYKLTLYVQTSLLTDLILVLVNQFYANLHRA